jgi:lysophospholipase L1-like esterase
MKKNQNIRLNILALGDSYTIGEGVSEADRWPNQLQAGMKAQGVQAAPPTILAKTGWTAGELLKACSSASFLPPYDLVTLLIGVNNQYRGLDAEDYRLELRSLLEFGLEMNHHRADQFIVVSIPDWGVTPFAAGRDRSAIAMEIDRFNRIKQLEAKRFGLEFVDITPLSRKAPKHPDWIAADGLHPSGEMYRRWAAFMLPVILQKLK